MTPKIFKTALAVAAMLAAGAACSPQTGSTPRADKPAVSHSTGVRPAPVAPLPIEEDPKAAKADATPLPPGLHPLLNAEALAPTFSKLARIESGEAGVKVRFVHYGDSHIASDLLTGQIRRRLQARFGDGGHGFILPGKPWRTYYHMDVDFGVGRAKDWSTQRHRYVGDGATDGILGLGGVSVQSTKRGASFWVATESDGPVGQKVGSFELFFLKQPSGAKAGLYIDGRRVEGINTRAPQFTPGYHTLRVPDGAHNFEVRHEGGGELRVFGTAMERENSGVVYDCVGINGARHPMPLAWNATVWKEHLSHRPIDVLVTTYGSNELGDQLNLDAYVGKVKRVVARYREAVPGGACLIMGPPDQALVFDGAAANADVLAAARQRAAADPNGREIWDTPQKLLNIIAALQRAATEADCAFWNTYEAIGGAGTIDTWARQRPRLAHKDRVHLTAPGYEIVANKLSDALIYAYERQKPTGP